MSAALESLHELRRLAHDEWPAKVYSDSGQAYTFAGVDEHGAGMYGGMSGFAFTLDEAQRYSAERVA